MIIINFFNNILKQTFKIVFELFKIMIPVIILVKILEMIGGIELLSKILSPVMQIIGLPGETGIVWATAMLTNLYAAIVVLVGMAGSIDLTGAQVTVLGTVMLIAHNMLVESQITKKAGTRYRFMFILRIGGAVAVGALLNLIYLKTGTLQENVHIFLKPEISDPSLITWAFNQCKNFAWITLIIFTLVTSMKLLEAWGVTDLIAKILAPVFRFIGIGSKATTLAMIGLTLGLAYGGGLIINEAKSGKLTDKDIFFSLSLLGLSHSLIEDTLLMMLIGGSTSGLLWGRLISTIFVLWIMVFVINRLPEKLFYKYLFVPKPMSEKV